MPELPDIVLYVEALKTRILDEPLTGFRLRSPFALRSVDPSIEYNYCAKCQTGGRLLAARSPSRLLKGDWPRSIDDSNQ